MLSPASRSKTLINPPALYHSLCPNTSSIGTFQKKNQQSGQLMKSWLIITVSYALSKVLLSGHGARKKPQKHQIYPQVPFHKSFSKFSYSPRSSPGSLTYLPRSSRDLRVHVRLTIPHLPTTVRNCVHDAMERRSSVLSLSSRICSGDGPLLLPRKSH